jgi:hypothetical protein
MAALLPLAGCNHIFSNSPKVVLPSTPPLSAEVLEQTAGTCQKEIERLHSRRPYVPKERKKEFETVLGIAEDTCADMVDTLSRLKAATHQEQSFRQNVQHAEATMLPGTVISDTAQGFDSSTAHHSSGNDIAAEPLR